MSKNFFEGTEVSLVEMLDAREKRADTQSRLLQEYPEYSLLSVTMNIPGPVKTNDRLQTIFFTMCDGLVKRFPPRIIKRRIFHLSVTGPECYFLMSMKAKELKSELVLFEEKQPLGRLFDLDVLYWDKTKDKLGTIGRKELNLPPRKCFICQDEAKICGRERRHSVEEMQQVIGAWLQGGEVK